MKRSLRNILITGLVAGSFAIPYFVKRTSPEPRPTRINHIYESPLKSGDSLDSISYVPTRKQDYDSKNSLFTSTALPQEASNDHYRLQKKGKTFQDVEIGVYPYEGVAGIPFSEVTITSVNSDEEKHIQTDRNGYVTIPLPPQNYYIEAVGEGYFPRGVVRNVVPSPSPLEIKIGLEQAQLFSGRVTAEDGVPLEDVNVSLINSPLSTQTNSFGEYSFPARSTFPPNNNFSYTLEGFQETLLSEINSPRADVVLKRKRRLEGIVYADKGVLTQGTLSLWEENSPFSKFGTITPLEVTISEGSYNTNQCNDGRYLAVIRAEGEIRCIEEIRITSSFQIVDFRTSEEGQEFSATLYSGNLPLKNAEVTAIVETRPTLIFKGSSDNNGRASIPLPSGKFPFTLNAENGEEWFYRSGRQETRMSESGREIEMISSK